MAKINIDYDTVEKTCAITIDGKAVSNVKECSVMCNSYSDDDEEKFAFYLTTGEEDKDNGMHKMQLIRASMVDGGKTLKDLEGYFSSLLNNKGE